MTMPERDEPTGALVRPYAVTRGRTRPKLQIALEALVETTVRGRTVNWRFGQGSEHQYIAAMCDGGVQSLAEIAARMQLPLGVARVIVADMASDGTGRGLRADARWTTRPMRWARNCWRGC